MKKKILLHVRIIRYSGYIYSLISGEGAPNSRTALPLRPPEGLVFFSFPTVLSRFGLTGTFSRRGRVFERALEAVGDNPGAGGLWRRCVEFEEAQVRGDR